MAESEFKPKGGEQNTVGDNGKYGEKRYVFRFGKNCRILRGCFANKSWKTFGTL